MGEELTVSKWAFKSELNHIFTKIVDNKSGYIQPILEHQSPNAIFQSFMLELKWLIRRRLHR